VTFEDKELRRIPDLKKGSKLEERKQHNEELRSLSSSPGVDRIEKDEMGRECSSVKQVVALKLGVLLPPSAVDSLNTGVDTQTLCSHCGCVTSGQHKPRFLL
jgi:hypothetical protein